MAINRVGVENFQSLRKVDIELGRFTVIVGPSNSGKSAFIRAIKALVSNPPGKSFITTGAKQCAVIVAREDGVIVALGQGTKDHYIISKGESEKDVTFTKLSGKVPEQVTQVVRIAPVKGSSINFAGQFDRPYLLDDSGAEVARTLGELTKVTVLFSAAREANRRKLAAGTVLRTKEAELVQLQERAQSYTTLVARIAAAAEAETAVEALVSLTGQRDTLASLVSTAQVSAAALAQVQVQLTSLPTAVDIPVEGIEAKERERYTLAALIGMLQAEQRDIKMLADAVVAHEQGQATADQALTDYLASLDHCPTCGSAQAHFHPDLVSA